MLWAYELDMILADSKAMVIPALATRQHPFVYSLKTVVEQSIAGNGPLGPIESPKSSDSSQTVIKTVFLVALPVMQTSFVS